MAKELERQGDSMNEAKGYLMDRVISEQERELMRKLKSQEEVKFETGGIMRMQSLHTVTTQGNPIGLSPDIAASK